MDSDTQKLKELVRDVLSEATNIAGSEVTYVTNVQLYFGVHEVTLDLFYLGPNAKPNVPNAQAQRLARIVLPVSVAKEVGELLLNGTSKWEDEFGITLPIQPRNTSGEPTDISGLNEDKSNV